MLKIAESYMIKEKAPLLLVDKISKKKTGKKGSKKKLNPKGVIIKWKKRKKASKQDTYFHCGKTDHWKRNCKSFFATVKAGASIASRGMYKIHTILSLSSSRANSWILNTACGTHVCKSLQRL